MECKRLIGKMFLVLEALCSHLKPRSRQAGPAYRKPDLPDGKEPEPLRPSCSLIVVTRNRNATATLGFVLSAIAITAAMGAVSTSDRSHAWDGVTWAQTPAGYELS